MLPSAYDSAAVLQDRNPLGACIARPHTVKCIAGISGNRSQLARMRDRYGRHERSLAVARSHRYGNGSL